MHQVYDFLSESTEQVTGSYRANIHEVFHSITVILEISERARVCNYCIALCRYR